MTVIDCACSRATAGIRLPWSRRPLSSFGGSLLFARRERSIELTVDEEIGEYPTRTPWYAIGPTLDAGGSFFINEYIPAHDQLVSLPIMRTAETMSEGTVETSFEDKQSILRGLNMPSPCRNARWGLSTIHLCHKAESL